MKTNNRRSFVRKFLPLTNFYLLAITFFLFNFATAFYPQSKNGIIRGIIIDSKTHLPLEGANIAISSEKIYTTSDKNGKFEIYGLTEENQYIVEISYIGYRKISSKLKAKTKYDKDLYVLHMDMIAVELKEAVISGKHSNFIIQDKDELFKTVSAVDITKEFGMTLASTLRNMASVSVRSMGPTTARPVLRGFGSDRIKILEDGMNISDFSATSPDHAVAFDATNAERIEIISGPKTLLYSPSISGGVINVEKNAIPLEKQGIFFGDLTGYYESVNKGFLGSASIAYPISRYLMSKSEITHKINDNIYTPKGYLRNTQAKTLNFSQGIALNYDKFKIGVGYGELRMNYGIPGGFLGAHLLGADIKIFNRNISIKSIYSIDNSQEFLTINFKNSYYKHVEYEDKSFLGATFGLEENVADLKYSLKGDEYYIQNLIAGISSSLINNFYGGYVFTPSTKRFANSMFFFGEKKLDLFETQFAVRFNYDIIKPSNERISRIGLIKKKDYVTYAGAFAIQYNFIKDMYIGSSISLNSKVPTSEELFSEGPHLAAYSYEIGNPELKTEKGIGGEIYLYLLKNKDKVMLNFYHYDYDRFITTRKSGDTNWATLLPIYKTGFVRALLYGMEFVVNKNVNPININFFIAYCRGLNKTEKLNLPSIPPLKGRGEINFLISKELQFDYSINFAGSQNKTDIFEKKTSGYVTHSGSLRYYVLGEKIFHVINISVDNIFNSVYKNHLSRTKDYFPEAGRNLKIIYKMNF